MRIEDTEFRFVPFRNPKDQGQPRSRSLKIGDSDDVDSAAQFDGSDLGSRWMHAVVVDHGLVVDVQPGAVIGEQGEPIIARLVNPEPACVVDGKPFEA